MTSEVLLFGLDNLLSGILRPHAVHYCLNLSPQRHHFMMDQSGATLFINFIV